MELKHKAPEVTFLGVNGLLVIVLLLMTLFACGVGAPGDGSPATTVGPTTTNTPADDGTSDPLVGLGEVELVGSGYEFTEGPQWMPDEGVLLFSDVSDNTIYQVGADDEITMFRMPSDFANGLAVDPQGRLIAAESGARRVTRTERDGTVTPIADRFEGARLNQPNDVTVRSDGTVYFSDPFFVGDPSQIELDFRGLFRIATDGRLTAEWRGDSTEAPNGVALSPDENHLYLANSGNGLGEILIFDVAPDGSLSEGRTFTPLADADGMCVDEAGNLFLATPIGIQVFAPDGTLWGSITVPEPPSNCAFGGADGRTLYITAQTSLYRVTLVHPGRY